MTANDIDAIRKLAGRIRFRTCEPGTDHEAYELSRDAQALCDEIEQLRAEVQREQAEHQQTLRNQSALSAEVLRLRAGLEKVRAQHATEKHPLERELERTKAWGERYRDRHDRAAQELSAERVKTMKVATLKCWTNEDGKRFVFVTDLQQALGVPAEPEAGVTQ